MAAKIEPKLSTTLAQFRYMNIWRNCPSRASLGFSERGQKIKLTLTKKGGKKQKGREMSTDAQLEKVSGNSCEEFSKGSLSAL